MQVAAGPGTQIGFTDPIVNPQEIGRITPGGTAQRTVVTGGSGDPTGIVFGNDGAYWIARFGGNDLVRFTPAGLQTTLTGFSASAGPRQITKGPGDTLWVGLETAKKVARRYRRRRLRLRAAAAAPRRTPRAPASAPSA